MTHIKDLAFKYRCPTGKILKIAKKFNIPYLVKSDHGRYSVFGDDEVRYLDKVMRNETTKPFEIRADRTEHPLVTDKRCLDFNYWPDVVPIVFQNDDDE